MSGPSARVPATFSPLAVAGMVGVGLACFAGFIVLLAFARGPHAGDGGAHAASRSAVGFAGLVQLLRDGGTPVRAGRGSPQAGAPGLRVLTPAGWNRGPATMPPLPGTVLVVLPKWRTSALPDHPGWVRQEGLLPDRAVLGVLPKDWPGVSLQRRAGTAPPALQGMEFFGNPPPLRAVAELQVVAAKGWVPVLQDKAGGILLGQPYEDGPYVLADPDLLNNLALADLAGAEAAVALITTLVEGQPVAFDLSLDGFGRSRDLLRMLLAPPLLGPTLCALAAAALVGLLSLRRFGPAQAPARAYDPGKRALADNSAALIALAGRDTRMVRPYAELTRSLAARAAAAPRQLGADGLDAYLDRAARLRGLPDSFTALLAEASQVRDRAGLVRVARRLHHWRTTLHG